MTKVRYGFKAHHGKFSSVPVWYTGTEEQARQFFLKLCSARDYVAEHNEETPPPGTLREATSHGATFYFQNPDEGNDLLVLEIVAPAAETPKTEQPQPAAETPKTEQPQPEQSTETQKTHKKTPDTTDKKLRRIFAELARIKEDIAELQMRR